MSRLAIIVSHPIQYNAPLFKELSLWMELKVFYCYDPSPSEIGKDGFGKSFNWDIDLLDGYAYEFLDNISNTPSLSSYRGCDTPSIGLRLKEYNATHVVVFGWYLKSFIQARSYCNRYGIPIAVRGDSQLDPLQKWYKRLLKKIYYPFYLNKFDAFLSVGKRNKEYLLNFRIKPEKIIFSPHAIDQEFWKGNRELNSDYIFIWVAKFISKKRPLDVIRAFEIASKKMSNVELRMIGSGALMDQAKEMASGNEKIKFLGFKNQTELRKEYLKADTLILSSDFGETWGLVVNEAYACGLNAIVSDACGCSVDMINEGIGADYPLGDVEELADRMAKIVGNRDNLLVKEKEQKERSKLNQTFSFNRNVDSFLEFIKNFK